MRKSILLLAAVILVIGGVGIREVVLAAQTNPDPNNYRVPILGSATITRLGHPSCDRQYHQGTGSYLDMSFGSGNTDEGVPIYSSGDGQVTASGLMSDYHGGFVRVENSEVVFQYLHLAKVYVHAGQSVSKGDLIGLLGDTGRSAGAHLHWEGWALNGGSFSIYDIPGVNETYGNPCGNSGTVNGGTLPSNSFTSCPDFYAQGLPNVHIFDHKDCRGNHTELQDNVNYVLGDSLDHVRSIYVPSGKSIYISPDANNADDWGLCHSNDMWNLDVDTYQPQNIVGPAGPFQRIGWNNEQYSTWSNPWFGSRPLSYSKSVEGGNLVHFIRVFNNSDCAVNGVFFPDTFVDGLPDDVLVGSYTEGIGGSSASEWLYEFSRSNSSPTTIQIHTRVKAEPGVYDAHRIVWNGNNVICETSAGEQTCNWDLSGLATGNYTVGVQYRRLSDGGNWANALSYEESFYLADLVPPETTATVSGTSGNNGWYVSSVTVTLSATDNSGVANTYYRIDGGATVEGTSLNLSSDNIYNVTFWSVDVNGNIEEEKLIVVMIDQTPPETSGTATGPRDTNGIFRDNVTADIISTDNLSGVDFTNCSYDGGVSWAVLSGTQIFLNGNGVHQFYCYTQDIAGNVGETLDSGPIIINMYVIFNRSAANGFLLRSNTGVTINGDIYSEGSVLFERNTNTHVQGSVEIASSSFTNDSTNTNLTVGNVVTNAQHVDGISYPFNYYWQRCTTVYENDTTINSVGQELSGVICVNGDLVVTTVSMVGDVTFVVNGDINFHPTCGWFYTNDPDNGMIMYATGNISLGGNCYDMLGLVYANGSITNKSTDTDALGSYVADHVSFDRATGATLSYDAAFAPGTFELPLGNASFYDPADGAGQPGPEVTVEPPEAPTETPVPTATEAPIPPAINGINLDWTGGTSVHLAFVFENADPNATHTVAWTCDSATDTFTGATNAVQLDHICPTTGSVSAVITVYGYGNFAQIAAEVTIPDATAMPTHTPTATATATNTDEPTATSTAPATETSNSGFNSGLVQNGSFEQLTAGWPNDWYTESPLILADTSSQGNDGTNSLHFVGNSTQSEILALSYPIEVDTSASYVWSSFVRSTGGSGEFGFYIDEYDVDGNWISGQWFDAIFDEVASTFDFVYSPSGSNVVYADLQYYMLGGTTFKVYVDSVSLFETGVSIVTPKYTEVPTASSTPVPTATETSIPTVTTSPTITPEPGFNSGLAPNGSFENLTNGWADGWHKESPTIGIDTGGGGNHAINSLHFSPYNGQEEVLALSDRIEVSTSSSYTWSMYVKATGGSGELGFYVDEYGVNGEWISGQWFGMTEGSSEGVVTFVYSPSSPDVIHVDLQYYMLGGTTFEAYIDSVSFVES